MKFRFCGDADCPDWLLMQINTLSSLESDVFEDICQVIVKNLQGEELDYGRLKERRKSANLDMRALKACTAGIAYILRSGVSYCVPSNVLGAELEQLGLEPHLSSIFVNVYSSHFDELRKSAMSKMLSLPSPTSISAERLADTIQLSMSTTVENEQKKITMTAEQAALLLQELKQVADRMDSLTE
ncbi:HCaRG protein [Nesidiocoris tenuis]|uniref:HCaRG protein n=1 Tax=Nesidiocoris tenuis TaxID=355587 RepID=A0ABN7BC80_9HEMI|nr:HCaRG protein [Nesidiocoris tenuis]